MMTKLKLYKEFRYLRTVIVTAAVYWGFSQKLWLAPNILP